MKFHRLAIAAVMMFSGAALAVCCCCTGCVTADYQQPDGTRVGYTSWFKDVSATTVKATAPNGASLEITGAQGNVNTQAINALTNLAGQVIQTGIKAGAIPTISVPSTLPAK